MDGPPNAASEAVAKQLVKLIEVPKMNVQRVLDFIGANPDALFTPYLDYTIPGPTPTRVYKLPLALLLPKKLSRETFSRILSLNPQKLREPDGYGLLHLHHALISGASSEVIQALIDAAPDTAAILVPTNARVKEFRPNLQGKTPLDLAKMYKYGPVVINRIMEALAGSNEGRAASAAASAAANAVAAALLEEESAAAAAVSAKAAARAAKAAAKKPAAAAAAAAAPAPQPPVAPGINLAGVELNYGVLPNNGESEHNRFLREMNLLGKLNGGTRRRRRRRSTYRSRKH